MHLDALDWEVLDRLRATFLSEARTGGPYWHTITDLECYDLTYGERIGWKWDAVLRELRLRGWTPRAGATVLDWGCGSGVAGRRVIDFFGTRNFSGLVLHDHSALALDFAEHRARATLPGLTVERASHRFLNDGSPIDLLVISHVLNELSEIARAELGSLLARARGVLWVEPGTHEVSRDLAGWREQARTAGATMVAPCTHQTPCGLLTPGNERHWCHFFAAPPPNIFADSNWVKFGQRAGIDLRSLPYSFLVLEQPPESASPNAGPALAAGPVLDAIRPSAEGLPCNNDTTEGTSRILGEPRLYKGYAKLFNCSAAGVEELTLQQRVDKALFKELKRARGPLLYRWTRDGAQITAAERPGPADTPAAAEDAHPESGTP